MISELGSMSILYDSHTSEPPQKGKKTMFGNNLISKAEHELDGQTLAVQEIFYTLQGEGPFSGHPAVFIRLAGCNLACSFCDTQFDSGLNNHLGIDQIMKQVASLPHNDLVVLTGGEPMRQNILPLISALVGTGRRIQIETAGTLWLPGLTRFIEPRRPDSSPVVLVVSPKTPKLHEMALEYAHDFKYVIEAERWDPTDGLPYYGTQPSSRMKQMRLARPRSSRSRIWVSPCDAYDKDKNQANLMAARDIALTFGYRLSLQVHKIVKLP